MGEGMGEAARRKRDDPLYGKVSQKDRFRGIIVSPPIEIEGNHLYARHSNLDQGELRFSLLYWDRLVWPSSRAIHFPSSNDETYLEDTGHLERPDYTFNGDAAQGIARGQITAFLDREQGLPGAWSMAQGKDSLLIKSGVFQDRGGISLDLFRAIPTPQENVPLEEIIEFREKRKTELILLRHKIDSLAHRVNKAENKETELAACISEIDAACYSLLQCSREWQSPIYLSNLKVSIGFNPLAFLGSAKAGFELGQSYGLEAALGLGAAGGIASCIQLNSDIGFQNMKRPPNPFRYAYQAQIDLS